MASVSMPNPLHEPPPFADAHLSPSPRTPAHARKHSRSPSALPLPQFSFNPTIGAATIEDHPWATNTSEVPLTRSPPPAALPNFKFNPGANLPDEDPLPASTHPVLEEMALNQQRASRSARPAPLPAFTFNPGGSAQSTPSPAKADFGEASHTRPVGGHKRGGSEFVGGGGTDGPTMVTTSPQKQDSKVNMQPAGVPGRRGHQHRRSQAISVSDIETSDLIKVNAIARARRESGPRTPSESTSNFFSGGASPQQPHSPLRSPPASPRRLESAPGNRPRVEFADTIDVIPRPLSLISSETDGSNSTARHSHSFSNSISSIASPAQYSSTPASPILEEDQARPRPKTADPLSLASLVRPPVERSRSDSSVPKRPLSACESLTPTTDSVSKKKYFWSSSSPNRTPSATPKLETCDPFANWPSFADSRADSARPKTSPERSASITRRKKSTHWAESFFKKTSSKQRASKSKPSRSGTPPKLQRRTSDQFNKMFDADDTVVLRSESPEQNRLLSKPQPKLIMNMPSPSFSESPEEVTSPILDLDAALGPFGSEQRFGSEQNVRTAASRIARLHSSERRGIMDAFGGIHRRTESAPTTAFNRSAFSLSHHDSNPSLADVVFDEEEEDNFLAAEMKTENVADAMERPAQASCAQDTPLSCDAGLGLANVAPPDSAVVIVDPDNDLEPGDRSSKSTIEAPFSEDELSKRPATSPMSFAYPSTQSHYASSTEGRTTTSASMISSPDPEHLYFDIPRAGNTYERHSPVFLRPSNEDLPSLCDSVSSGPGARISSSGNTRSSTEHRRDEQYAQRAASMFVPHTSRPQSSSGHGWKRSSLASLNRLIPGSANGSKLKFETSADTDVTDEDVARRRSHRLSKLVNFWRSRKVDK